MRLAIIIPFRNRDAHLKIAAPILKRYGNVYVIEQTDKKPFNRGKLFNAGFQYFKDDFDYFCAHDVDLLPLKVDYSFSILPCHLAAEVEHLNWHLPYETYFGGVTLLPNDKFEIVNGFSNDYWGWGGEDDELRRRFIQKEIAVCRRDCRFNSLPHVRYIDNGLLKKNRQKKRDPIDWNSGLSSCEYKISGYKELQDYKLLQVML